MFYLTQLKLVSRIVIFFKYRSHNWRDQPSPIESLVFKFFVPFFHQTASGLRFITFWKVDLFFLLKTWRYCIGQIKITAWENVQKARNVLIRTVYIDCRKNTDEFSLISNYITSQKVTESNNADISTETRWVEVFKYFLTNNVKRTIFCF